MSNNKSSRPQLGRKRKGKKPHQVSAHAVSPLLSVGFQDKVNRLDKLMQLASVTPKAPPGFTLIRKDGEVGTLEQVGREADNAWAGVKRIMQLLNVEKKHCFYNYSQTVNQSGVVQDLSGQIAQGVGGAQRTGDSLKITRLRGKFRVLTNGNYDTVQVVIGRAKDGLPTAAELFQLIGSGLSGLSFQNDDENQTNVWLHSFTVLTAPATGNAAHFREFELKIDVDTLFVAGTTTATSGSVWCAMISQAAINLPTVEANFDMEFVDN
jgi:hypothetical protein